MKLFIAFLALVTASLAAESPIPTGALLVLPPNSNTSSTTNTTTTTPAPQSDNLEELNARIMEQLRQQIGAKSGVYHIYFPDGRLQRVQYTTAPVSSVPSPLQQPSMRNLNGDQQAYKGISVTPQAVYFVQVPADSLQDQKFPQSSVTMNTTETANRTSSQADPILDPRYRQSPAENSTPAIGEYLPITVISVDQLSQHRASTAQNTGDDASQQTQAGEQKPRSVSSSQRQSSARQGQPISGYVASIQYSDVDPIPAPIYSYSPQPLVRILRYAV